MTRVNHMLLLLLLAINVNSCLQFLNILDLSFGVLVMRKVIGSAGYTLYIVIACLRIIGTSII